MDIATSTTDEEWTLAKVVLGVLLSSAVRVFATAAASAVLPRFPGVDAHRDGVAAAAAG